MEIIMNKRKAIYLWLLCLVMLLCSGISALADSDEDATALLSGKTAGVMTGTPQDAIILAKVPDAKIQYFNSLTDVILALEKNKIDFAGLPTVSYNILAEEYPDLGYLDIPLAVYDVGTVFQKNANKEALREQLNEYIQSLKDSGELEKKQQYWLYPNDWQNIDIPKTGENGTLKMATTVTLKPFSFSLNNQCVGYEIDIIAGFCREYGYGLNIETLDFAGILSGITTGKYDLAAAQISWTEERGESVDFSDFYYTQTFVPIVKSDKFDTPLLVTSDSVLNASKGDGSGYTSPDTEVKSSLGRSIQRTLVDEDRWMLLLNGLLVTLLITAAGFILANILGAVFCAMSLSDSRILKALANIYSQLMQGLPIVVILMILYYIIFGKSDISNTLVAILGFGIVFGAYMAQLFEGGIRSVDKGQREAALATGLTKTRTFCGIVLPQAIRTILPGYFSNIINLMKGTAVVGYIAVNDLTKVGDNIRSNTYEAIVPLVTISLIYLAIACLLLFIMSLIRKKLTSRRTHAAFGIQKAKGGFEV